MTYQLGIPIMGALPGVSGSIGTGGGGKGGLGIVGLGVGGVGIGLVGLVFGLG